MNKTYLKLQHTSTSNLRIAYKPGLSADGYSVQFAFKRTGDADYDQWVDQTDADQGFVESEIGSGIIVYLQVGLGGLTIPCCLSAGPSLPFPADDTLDAIRIWNIPARDEEDFMQGCFCPDSGWWVCEASDTFTCVGGANPCNGIELI